MALNLAISGASGKTGYRVAEEALAAGFRVRLLTRKGSQLPPSLSSCDRAIFSLENEKSIDDALIGCDALLIATGARPSPDLTGPARIDAVGVKRQIESCKRVNINRLILVSSLCAGRWLHPLNLFGLILLWKRVGEKALEQSGLDWTIIRPGGLSEREENLDLEGIRYTQANMQEDAYIPRRLLAKCCIEALKTNDSIGKILEVTSSPEQKPIKMQKAIQDIFFPAS